MSNSDLAGEFHVLMRSVYYPAKSECGYNATRSALFRRTEVGGRNDWQNVPKRDGRSKIRLRIWFR